MIERSLDTFDAESVIKHLRRADGKEGYWESPPARVEGCGDASWAPVGSSPVG